jgi:hypothetical protein
MEGPECRAVAVLDQDERTADRVDCDVDVAVVVEVGCRETTAFDARRGSEPAQRARVLRTGL